MGIAQISKQRTRKFVTKFLGKHVHHALVKLFLTERIILHKISIIELQKISAKNMLFFAKHKCMQKCKYGIIYSSITWSKPDR